MNLERMGKAMKCSISIFYMWDLSNKNDGKVNSESDFNENLVKNSNQLSINQQNGKKLLIIYL